MQIFSRLPLHFILIKTNRYFIERCILVFCGVKTKKEFFSHFFLSLTWWLVAEEGTEGHHRSFPQYNGKKKNNFFLSLTWWLVVESDGAPNTIATGYPHLRNASYKQYRLAFVGASLQKKYEITKFYLNNVDFKFQTYLLSDKTSIQNKIFCIKKNQMMRNS